ncbi:MAG TPA: hypothetical protein VH877_16300 [Polyangia bacterium]|nr:hypothetical protein [Polyangia bacterium]
MRASSLIESGSVIELIGYELAADADREAFSTAWRAAVDQAPRPTGLLYRELALQRSDWNATIRAEIMSPNPFPFLDYAVFRSAADQAAYHASGGGVPPALPGSPQVTAGVYTVGAQFVRLEAPGEPGMLLYNLFKIQGDEKVEEAFASRWPERAKHQAERDGFYSAILHRKARPELPLTAFNRAEWQDVEHYAKTLADFERNFPRAERAAVGQAPGAGPPPARSLLGLFEILHTLS